MLRKRRGLTTVALVAGLALTAAACGGSSGGGTGDTTDEKAVKGGHLNGNADASGPATSRTAAVPDIALLTIAMP